MQHTVYSIQHQAAKLTSRFDRPRGGGGANLEVKPPQGEGGANLEVRPPWGVEISMIFIVFHRFSSIFRGGGGRANLEVRPPQGEA